MHAGTTMQWWSVTVKLLLRPSMSSVMDWSMSAVGDRWTWGTQKGACDMHIWSHDCHVTLDSYPMMSHLMTESPSPWPLRLAFQPTSLPLSEPTPKLRYPDQVTWLSHDICIQFCEHGPPAVQGWDDLGWNWSQETTDHYEKVETIDQKFNSKSWMSLFSFL